MRLLKYKLVQIIVSSLLLVVTPISIAPVYASNTCGAGDNAVTTTIDFGCQGQGNPIYDMAYALIRFLSNGVGLIVVGSLVFAGIQYSTSRGDPKAAEAAQNRIQATVIALLIYIFAWALLNYLLPGGLLHP